MPARGRQGRQCRYRQVGSNQSLNTLYIFLLIESGKRHRPTGKTSSPGASDSMDIIFGIRWQIVVDNQLDSQNINAAGGDIGRHQRTVLSGLKTIERFATL